MKYPHFSTFHVFAVTADALAGVRPARRACGQRSASAAVARLTPRPSRAGVAVGPRLRRGTSARLRARSPMPIRAGQRTRAGPIHRGEVSGVELSKSPDFPGIPDHKMHTWESHASSKRGSTTVVEHKRFDARLNVYVSLEIQRKLEQLRDQRGPQTTVPDLVREAIRLYIDNEEEIIGSRRHFQRGLRETIDATKSELLWNDLVTLAFMWQMLNPILNATTKQQTSFKEAWDRALAFAHRSGMPYLKTLEDAIRQAFIEPPTEQK